MMREKQKRLYATRKVEFAINKYLENNLQPDGDGFVKYPEGQDDAFVAAKFQASYHTVKHLREELFGKFKPPATRASPRADAGTVQKLAEWAQAFDGKIAEIDAQLENIRDALTAHWGRIEGLKEAHNASLRTMTSELKAFRERIEETRNQASDAIGSVGSELEKDMNDVEKVVGNIRAEMGKLAARVTHLEASPNSRVVVKSPPPNAIRTEPKTHK